MKLSITSEGGFTGRGAGSVTIDGDAVKADATCTGKLTDAERAEIRRLAAAAKPESWKHSYAPEGHADYVQYTLTLGRHSVRWYDSAEDALPRDVAALYAAAWKVRERVIDGCR